MLTSNFRCLLIVVSLYTVGSSRLHAMTDSFEDAATAVWDGGWAIAFDEAAHGMALVETSPGTWSIDLRNISSYSSLGTGAFTETLRVAPLRLEASQAEAAQAGFVSWKSYYVAGVIDNDDSWSMPVILFVTEVVANDPNDNPVTAIGASVRYAGTTITDTENELVHFTSIAFGGSITTELEEGSISPCIQGCKDVLDIDLDLALTTLDADLDDCKDNFLAGGAGCVTGSFLCGPWYGLCLGGCLAADAIWADRCMDRAKDVYLASVDAANMKYDICVATCVGASIE